MKQLFETYLPLAPWLFVAIAVPAPLYIWAIIAMSI